VAKKVSEIYKNKERVIKNIKAIRCYMQWSQREFGRQTKIGKRAEEFETGRFRPTMDEIEKIAAIAEVKPENIIHNVLYITLQIT